MRVVGCALTPLVMSRLPEVMSKCARLPACSDLPPPVHSLHCIVSPTDPGKPPCCVLDSGWFVGDHARFRQLGSAMLSMPMLMPLPMSDKMSLRHCGTNLSPPINPRISSASEVGHEAMLGKPWHSR
ncbi:hypothetical protein F5144DRAFT_575672 [Chaetomium tenue]|uniref:Uncharacterized protein n=1 Tax=Chaetomium tenue TaxID=1854479 RepID=A0ACB7P4Y9_9PEZI|nr:hypothetical protein F5144DRAFT_575672 [Chaetomium globosum]